MWSDDIRPRHLECNDGRNERAFDAGAAGVVITHGTDTMHFSAAAFLVVW